MKVAAKVIEFNDLRLGLPDDEGPSGAAGLIRSARELVDKILHGWPERIHLRDTDGNVIPALTNRAPTTPRATDASSDYF